ncbi:hypothetical protein L6250_01850 [Candidatus Parcubacteria bacterium]|nr:hypothetical protein [Patescibacteria group bacterium]MBU4466616.1 hypothetical protein [Patescibacteria group bacterium]MCG2688358.1 hypothetical protein [Candidatus Parcubacteria bacterium]
MKYLLTPSEYKLPNPRIDGIRKLKEINARTIDIFIFSLKAFDYFSKHQDLPAEMIKELKTLIPKIIKSAPTHSIAVRRAYVVPGLENPPGPRFIAQTSVKEVVKAIKEIYSLAISQNYHKNKNSQVTGFFHASIGTPKLNKEKIIPDHIPYGGYAIKENGKVEIYAVFGMNEGVQSLVADRYLVETQGQGAIIVKKEIPQKNKMLCPTENSQAELLSVPPQIQFNQVLFDNEILEVSKAINDLSEKYGPQRGEFSSDRQGIIFIEAMNYWKEEKQKTNLNKIKGKVTIINDITDLQKLKKVNKEKLKKGEIIILVGEELVRSRNYNILGALTAWKDPLYILYPGIVATQHAMRVLTDKGHKAFLIGSAKFKEGNEVQITASSAGVRIINLSRSGNRETLSLWDVSLFNNDLCGNKAYRLSKLKISGFQIPHGSVLTTIVFDKVIKKLGFKTPVKLKDFPKLQRLLKNPPQNIINGIEKLVLNYSGSEKHFAVRSSTTIEDGDKESLAGLFETCLNVPAKEITKNVIKVISSAFKPDVVTFLNNDKNLVNRLKMAIVIQEMVKVNCAGVIFGTGIQTNNEDIVEIEAVKGLGEKIVSGKAKKIEQYRFSRSEKIMVWRQGPKVLSFSQASALFLLSERLRQEFNDTPQDIEWAIDKQGQIWILQSRNLYIPRPSGC